MHCSQHAKRLCPKHVPHQKEGVESKTRLPAKRSFNPILIHGWCCRCCCVCERSARLVRRRVPPSWPVWGVSVPQPGQVRSHVSCCTHPFLHDISLSLNAHLHICTFAHLHIFCCMGDFSSQVHVSSIRISVVTSATASASDIRMEILFKLNEQKKNGEQVPHVWAFVPALCCGVLGGIVGTLFVAGNVQINRWRAAHINTHKYVICACCYTPVSYLCMLVRVCMRALHHATAFVWLFLFVGVPARGCKLLVLLVATAAHCVGPLLAVTAASLVDLCRAATRSHGSILLGCVLCCVFLQALADY